MGTVATVVVDGVDITPSVIEGSVTARLNRISDATIKVQMKALSEGFGTTPAGVGSMLKVYFQTDNDSTPRLYHHGRVLLCETTCDENNGYTVLNSADPLELWAHRPVRDAGGNMAAPGRVPPAQSADLGNLDGFNGTKDGPSMIAAMFNNSESAGGGPPVDAEGPLRMALNSVTPGVQDVSAPMTDFPTTMAQLMSLIVSTGQVDVIVTPIEFDASMNYAQLDLYPGQHGLDLTSSVVFQYGMGLFNVRALRWNSNMNQVCNKLQYFLGPKKDQVERWQSNITGDHPSFNSDGVLTGAWALATPYVVSDVVTKVIGPNTYYFIAKVAHTSTANTEPGVAGTKWPTAWDPWLVPPGGRTSPPASSVNNQLGVARYHSQQLYDVRMDIKIFDSHDNPLSDTAFAFAYAQQWIDESWFRAIPQNLYHVTPSRDTGIGEFDIGDIVLVEACSDVRGGFSGGQRVYSYTISWDAQDSVPSIAELQVSSDQEGL